MKKSTKPIRWKDLSISQAKEVKSIINKSLPYVKFDFVEDRVFLNGVTGSDADFMEIGVETLFDLVTKALYEKQINCEDYFNQSDKSSPDRLNH